MKNIIYLNTKKHVCLICGTNLLGLHPSTKYCTYCKYERKKNLRRKKTSIKYNTPYFSFSEYVKQCRRSEKIWQKN